MIPIITIATAPAAVTIGRSGEWVGPLIVGLLAGLLDYSAIGPSAIRDRVAVMGYYACTISLAAVLGWTTYVRDQVQDYNWQMTGAIISLIAHGALLIAMFGGLIGPTKALAKQISKKIKFGGSESDAARINQTLLGWTIGAGLAAPLSGDQGFGHLVDGIANITTGFWSALVTTVMHWLGG